MKGKEPHFEPFCCSGTIDRHPLVFMAIASHENVYNSGVDRGRLVA